MKHAWLVLVVLAMVAGCKAEQAAPTPRELLTTSPAVTASPAATSTPAPAPTLTPRSSPTAAEHCSFSPYWQLAYEVDGMAEVEVHCDIVFKTLDDGTELTFDLYLPPEAAAPDDPLPLVVLVHGNETDVLKPVQEHWKRDMYTHGLVSAASGFAAVAFNYRGYMSGNAEAMADAQQDVLDLLAYLAETSDELTVDGQRTCLWTTSGGGIPGAWAALFGDPQPRCAVIMSGSLGSTAAADRSPDAFVTADLPPFFIAYGKGDVYARGAQGFIEQAAAVGADVTVREHPSGANSHFEQMANEESAAIIAEALAFIAEHLAER